MAKSALGVEINMASMIARNEKVRAVGNMKVNARGDLLDSNNNIITNANKRVESSYNQSVSDDSSGIAPTFASTPTDMMHDPGLTIDPAQNIDQYMEELLPEEQELFEELDEEPEVKKNE
jgi:GTP-sensing pleiotropic transcriptional regulator CodY